MNARYQYSVVRYVPNVIRDEAVNVGVLVRSVADAQFEWRFLPRSSVVRKLWPTADQNLVHHLDRQLKAAANAQGSFFGEVELVKRFGDPGAAGFVERASSEFNGNLQFTELRGLLSESLDDALHWTYRTYVEEPEATARPINFQAMAPLRIRTRLWTAFERRDLIKPRSVSKSVRIDGRHAPWTFDLSYRNGSLNMVSSLALSGPSLETNLGRALVFKGMVEDVVSVKHDARGVAIASLDDGPGATQAVKLLNDSKIEVVDIRQLGAFVDRVEDELASHRQSSRNRGSKAASGGVTRPHRRAG